jgi:hypothetical protein
MPTVAITAPPIAAFDKDEDYRRLNALLLRNTSVVNFLDGCAVSLPIPTAAPPGEADGGRREWGEPQDPRGCAGNRSGNRRSSLGINRRSRRARLEARVAVMQPIS